jgi:hypothetical protein
MDTINTIRTLLAGVAEGADESQVVGNLSMALPVAVRQKIGRGLLASLVSARLSQLHYDARAEEFSREIKEMESNPDDERGMWMGSWERDVDRALDGRDRAGASVESNIKEIARALADSAQANPSAEAPSSITEDNRTVGQNKGGDA